MKVPQLKADLYPFQRRAVQWLLRREGVQWSQAERDIQPFVPPSPPEPISFSRVTDCDGNSFHISPLLGVATREVSSYVAYQEFRGGILAEEMGLGKTLEIISLILLHPRPDSLTSVFDSNLARQLPVARATLIIVPASLLDQWLSELDRHAPTLSVHYYMGLKKMKANEQISAQYLAQHDIVITTYEILRAEIYAATEPPERSMRTSRRYERQKCQLVEISWWRVCIDEAQMVENVTNHAAMMATHIPRINAWGITGTPVKDDVPRDLRGLLSFLRLEPYASDTRVWHVMTSVDKDSFSRLFNLISMRHTKSLVRSEIAIPPQKRYVVTMPFTAVEEQHYQTLFHDLAQYCGLDAQGNPLRDDWDPEDPAVQEAMRSALDRLRQTALHPEVGVRNRRALGHKSGPMRTVAEVLNAMLEQSDGSIRTEQRALLLMKLTRGQIHAGMNQVDAAKQIWEEVLTASTVMVSEFRNHLRQEMEASRKPPSGNDQTEKDESEGEDQEDNAHPRVGEARRRLRSALEIQHKAVFFCGNAYFSTKSNAAEVEPDSDDFKRLESLEVQSYDQAKEIRKEILREVRMCPLLAGLTMLTSCTEPRQSHEAHEPAL
jgi:E3 ubiquitin-protein ligase SHPRH